MAIEASLDAVDERPPVIEEIQMGDKRMRDSHSSTHTHLATYLAPIAWATGGLVWLIIS